MNFVKGILIGVALIIPGLSGSIFAVVVGVYDKILYCINNMRNKSSVFYLVPIALGCVIGIILSTKIVLWVCENYPMRSYLFFTGLVIGSIPLVFKNMKTEKINFLKIIILLASFILIILFSSMVNSQDKESSMSYIGIEELKNWQDFLIIFWAGIFSCSLMLIPGVSGSIMLMAINQYGTIYNSVGMLTDFLKHIISGNIDLAIGLLDTILIIIPFILGAIIGVVLIAKLIGFLLIHYESETYYGVCGLISGAILVLIKDGVIPNADVSITFISIIISIIICICGVLSTYLLKEA